MHPQVEKNLLQITLLGPPIVTYAGQVQAIKRLQTRAVLYYLASQKMPVSREALCAIFWPNLSEKAGRKNLREILSHIRTQFPDIEVITTLNDQLALNRENAEIDVRKFQSLIDRVRFNLFATPTGKLPESLYRELREGAALWRSSCFMDGFTPRGMPEFETWLADTAHELQHWQQSFLERLADHTISAGNLPEALYWLWQATQIDPLRTDLHFTTLTCLRDSGKTEEIVKYAEQLKKLYEIDHGLEIPDVLTNFITRTLEARDKFASHSGESDERVAGLQYPFVGRREILQQLHLWSLRGGIILLKGESGIGKSRLMQEFYYRVDFPIRSVFCNAQPMEQNLPFQPFIEGLRNSARSEDWQSLTQPQAAILTRLFPEIVEFRTDIQADPQSPLQESYQVIFEAVHSLLTGMMGQKRLVIFFDDVHWTDEGSLSLLSFLSSRGLFQKNGVLILASRIEEKNRNLQQFIHAIERRGDFHSYQLDYLNDKEVAELVYSVLGKMPPPEMITRLMLEVGGNPLFLHQTLKLVMDYSTNIDSLSVLKSFPIPHEVQAVIRERLDSLDSDSQVVANVCAVIGTSFTPSLVEDVCKLDQERLVEILDQLVNMHLLNEASEVKPAGGYAFAHEKIRDSILSDLSPARKRLLNLQVVAALEKRYGKPLALATRYAQYHEAAGELISAFGEWILAGQYARQLFSRTDAYFAYQRAFDLIKQNEELFSIKEIHELVTKWGNYAFDIQDKETCEVIYQSCFEMGEQKQNPLLIGTGQSGLARVMGMRNQFPSAIKRMRLALKSLEAGSWKGELIEAYTRLGNLYHLSNHFIQAREAYEKALSFTGEEGVRTVTESRVNARALLSILYAETGWPVKALALANQCLEDSQATHRITSRIQAYAARAIALFYTGNFREAVETGQVVLHDVEAKGMAVWGMLLNSALARSYISAGYLDKAWSHLEEAYKQGESTYMPLLVNQVHTIRGEMYRYLHHWDEAEKEYALILRDRDFDFISLETLYKLGYVKIANGDPAQGFALIDQASRESAKMDLGMISLPAQAALLISGCIKNGKIDDREAFASLIGEARIRGFMPLPLWLEFMRFTYDNREALTEDGRTELPDLIKSIHNSGHIWLDIQAQVFLLNSEGIPAEFKRQARQRLTTLCDVLYEHAVQEPVCEMVKRFTDGVEKLISRDSV